MDYTRESLSNGAVKFIYEVKGDAWEQAIDKSFNKNKSKFKVEGFRPGKAPKAFVIKVYGKGILFEDAIDICFDDAYKALMAENPIGDVFGSPEAGLIDCNDDGCKFFITLQGKPDVELGQYTALTVKREVKEITEEEINTRINTDLERASSFTELTEGAVCDGDTIELDYSGSVDGVKFDGGTAEKQTLVIGSKTFIPGFEEQLVGVNVGESKDVVVKFPDEYHAENLKGKEAVFNCKINAIKKKNVPELDDQFAQDISEYNTFAEYKEAIISELKKKEDERATISAENALVDLIVESTKIEVPEAIINSQSEQSIEEFSYRLQQQGLKLDDYLKYTGSTIEDMKKQYRDQSIKNSKVKLVLDSIIEKEKIEVSDDEINEKLREFAKMQKKDDKDIEEFVAKASTQYKDYAKQNAISDKLLAFLKEKNNIEG